MCDLISLEILSGGNFLDGIYEMRRHAAATKAMAEAVL